MDDRAASLAASSRLAAHPRAVHDVACELTAWVRLRYPRARFDGAAVEFGAAARDIGKVLEDLLVSLAGKVWKGKRVADLEQPVVDRLAPAGGQEPWEAFLAPDDALDRIAAGADGRPAFQGGRPTAG
ncbi:hypothetical protein [Actinosynnema mirum]|uniref:Uncharacterized protein n=1 Tax=Actinosynnema mirum (strain ATCC 29888 / DSM 43827 / JCM 3225 / NBRC 14064 / NCIMB 13271 / NRRL B-12336 / IMRU 3971 / 101) TaxID=446462 RepID=C6WLD4_ACTMD|nr:hypothetical protein [Actinosynnema mirum]ACU38327.1 hypothetical protein Amir_4483 [Actinosynnema mirum DSM 43827]